MPEPLSLTRQVLTRARPRQQESASVKPFDGVGELSYISPVETPRQGVRTREARIARLLACADVLAAAAALLISVVIIGQDQLEPGALMLLPVAVLVSKLAGLYDRDDNRLSRRTLDEGPVLFAVAMGYTLAFTLLQPYVMTGELGRDQLLGLLGSFGLLTLAARTVARRLALALSGPERCLAVGDRASIERIRAQLHDDPHVTADLIAEIELDPVGDRGRMEDFSRLAGVLHDLSVERAIFAPRSSDADETLDLIRAAKALQVKVSVLPRLFEVVGSSVVFDEVNGMTLLGVPNFGLGRSSRLVKRGFDILVASCALLLAAPLMLAIAVAVRLDSPGPVFFRQRRVGRGGHLFEVLKYRSMCADAEAKRADLEDQNETEGLFKITNDPRITRIGALLRRTSLDELPQLINVLRGEMSVVGPRPLVVDDDRHVIGWDRRRLSLTPGMTGPWQVLGSSRVPLQEMVKIDYLYAATWSLWSDVKILLRTALHVLGRKGL